MVPRACYYPEYLTPSVVAHSAERELYFLPYTVFLEDRHGGEAEGLLSGVIIPKLPFILSRTLTTKRPVPVSLAP